MNDFAEQWDTPDDISKDYWMKFTHSTTWISQTSQWMTIEWFYIDFTCGKKQQKKTCTIKPHWFLHHLHRLNIDPENKTKKLHWELQWAQMQRANKIAIILQAVLWLFCFFRSMIVCGRNPHFIIIIIMDGHCGTVFRWNQNDLEFFFAVLIIAATWTSWWILCVYIMENYGATWLDVTIC